MERDDRRSNLVTAAALVLSFFAIPHLIDDFLFDVPAEFGLSNQSAQVLAGVFTVVLLWIVALVGRDLRAGYYACAGLGVFLALAGYLKHTPRMAQPGPYWSGWFSELLIYGVMASGLVLAGISVWALRRREDRA